MRHKKTFRKFSRTPAHRRAMFRNMATALLDKESIETTFHKAKDLRGVVERLITLGKEDTVHHRRKAYGYLQDKAVVHKLFAEVGPRYKERPGGYTRVLRSRVRPGDAADMAVIQLVEGELQQKKSKKRKRSAGTDKKAAKASNDAPVEAAAEAEAPAVEAEKE